MDLKKFLSEVFEDEEFKDDKPRHLRLWNFLKIYLVACIVSTAMMLAYIEIGHDKGWPRADLLHTSLHNELHASWHFLID